MQLTNLNQSINSYMYKYMFIYNPETGAFWNFNTRKRAETTNSRSTVLIRWKRFRYTASRIAWLMGHGEDPGQSRRVAYRDGNNGNLALANEKCVCAPMCHRAGIRGDQAAQAGTKCLNFACISPLHCNVL